MSRLPRHSVDAQVPELSSRAKLSDLERRIQELERDRAQTARANYAVITPSGPWPTVAPPNGTTGNAITITQPGTYACIGSVTAQATANNSFGYVEWSVDGVNTQNSQLEILTTGWHQHMANAIFVVDLTAGTHYVYIRTVGMTSTTNDRMKFIAMYLGV